MKKWFMSALLPLLLLAQQEAGATPLPPETLVSTVGGPLGYTAKFVNQDLDDKVDGYDYTDITVWFAADIDLKVAYTLINNPSVQVPLSEVKPNTLMNFSTYLNDIPQIVVLSLLPTDPVTQNAYNVGNRQLNNTNTGPMTAFYKVSDLEVGYMPLPGKITCTRLGNGDETCAPIEPQAVPAPTSLMLLGIGLLALSVLQRRGKLS